MKHVTVNADQALVADIITTGSQTGVANAGHWQPLEKKSTGRDGNHLYRSCGGWGTWKKIEHRPHAKRTFGPTVWWRALSGTGCTGLSRLPNARRWRWRPFRKVKRKLQAWGADKGNYKRRPLRQRAGEECSRLLNSSARSLTTAFEILPRPTLLLWTGWPLRCPLLPKMPFRVPGHL